VTVRYELRYDAPDQLFDAIRRRGFRLVGPALRDGAICYGDITSAADLPAGWTMSRKVASTG
jgi:sulfhydrogenase subunit beta (sulfur reductase)